ncbi:toprim domain-containing protein [Aquabacterium sp.]|uniref:toprim domain-containing protein n=1 Tax=Aquabacterium sp. TaxID=1872578 RepID=UPI004037E22F
MLGEDTPSRASALGLVQAEPLALSARGLSEETCKKFGYGFGKDKAGTTVQVAPYFDGPQLVAQKLRYKDKQFKFIGEPKRAGLFGQQLWGESGKKLVITEGEIDCLTVSQLQGNKWPVVSIPNGAQSAKKELQRHLQWLLGYEEIILMFDMDEPGKKAASECAVLFPPGRCKIASLPLKDPNECLQQGRGAEVIQAIWNAKTYRPDGLVTFADVKERIKKPVQWGIPWWSETLTKLTYGRRFKEIYTFGAGTGIGKTDWLTQQIAFDMAQGYQVGLIFLETPIDELGKRIAGKRLKRRFHVPDAGWTQEELDEGTDWLLDKGILYDAIGQSDWDVIKAHIRFMAANGIRIFYLDHLTALADTQDEKGSLEQIMKELGGLVHELDIMLHLVSHLTTPDVGPPHEEGGRVTIRQFKGSRAIGFWSNFMFGLERNQQAEDEDEKQTTYFRVLKDRNTGQSTGAVIALGYDREAGCLFEKEPPPPENPFDTTSTSTSAPAPWDDNPHF